MTFAAIVRAPWTDEQVAALNRWQKSGVVHPFTCGNRDKSGHGWDREVGDYGVLEATPGGWVCRACGYRQPWAQSFCFDIDEQPEFRMRGALSD